MVHCTLSPAVAHSSIACTVYHADSVCHTHLRRLSLSIYSANYYALSTAQLSRPTEGLGTAKVLFASNVPTNLFMGLLVMSKAPLCTPCYCCCCCCSSLDCLLRVTCCCCSQNATSEPSLYMQRHSYMNRTFPLPSLKHPCTYCYKSLSCTAICHFPLPLLPPLLLPLLLYTTFTTGTTR
jgi:hypothetical protein